MNDVETTFVRLHPSDIALAKFLFESYEDVAVVRTLDRREAVIVVLATLDFAAVARAIVEEMMRMIECEVIAPPQRRGDDWLLAAMEDEDPPTVGGT